MGLTQIFPWLTSGNWDCEAPALAYTPPPCWSLRIIMAQILLWWTGWRRCHQPAHLSSPMSWGFSWEDKEWKRTSDQIFNIKMKCEDRGVPFSSGPWRTLTRCSEGLHWGRKLHSRFPSWWGHWEDQLLRWSAWTCGQRRSNTAPTFNRQSSERGGSNWRYFPRQIWELTDTCVDKEVYMIGRL